MLIYKRVVLSLLAVFLLKFLFFSLEVSASVNPCVDESGTIINGFTVDASGNAVPVTGPSSSFPFESAGGSPFTNNCNTCTPNRDVTITGRSCAYPAGGGPCVWTGGCCALSALPSTINEEESTTLSWTTTIDANLATIDNGIGNVVPVSDGSTVVSPTTTTTYNMSVSGPGGSANCQTVVTVIPAPPSCEIRAEPNLIFTGELSDVTVSWITDHATSATLNGVNVPMGSGTKIFNGVSSSTTYSMLVNGPGGSSSCEARVTAYVPPRGGLIPCGRLVDDSATSWNEKNPCRLCHLTILSFNIINFLLTIVGIIAVLMLIVAGALHIIGGIDAETLSLAKKGINGVLFGFAIIFVAWVIINIAMVVFGFIDPIGDGSWKKFDCQI